MGRDHVVVVAIVGVLGTPVTAAGSRQNGTTHEASRAALRYFASVHGGDFEGFLRRIRPAALAPDGRVEAISRLPLEGELIPTEQDAVKLRVIQPVLMFHERANELEVRLISVGGQAGVGLYARTVVLVSREALDLLEPDELQAVVAHELGHEYFWQEYDEARSRFNSRQVQELELRCDGVSIVTMHRFAVDAERLVSAVTKLTRHNERIGAVATAARYVSLPERVQFIRAVAALVAERTRPAVLGKTP